MRLTPMQLASLCAVGVFIGVVSGMLGIGGGILVIPTLVTLYGFTYPQAVGTSLGMLLPPIGIFAFLTYYRSGNVSIPAAAMLAAGFALGAFFGANLVNTGKIPQETLRILFALFLLYVGGSILFRSDLRIRAVFYTLILIAVAMVARLWLRALGRRWDKEYSVEQTYRIQLTVPIDPDYHI